MIKDDAYSKFVVKHKRMSKHNNCTKLCRKTIHIKDNKCLLNLLDSREG